MSEKPNILLISIEDLNDYISPLKGHPQVITPNIQKLADRGACFDLAYSTAPACSPARTAALFGQAPWETGVYTNDETWPMKYKPGQRSSLVGAIRSADYSTTGAGKIFFGGYDPEDWDQYFEEPLDVHEPISTLTKAKTSSKGLADFGPSDINIAHYDERNAEKIIEAAQRGAQQRFWSLGIYRPHLPFIVPQKYFDLYPDVVKPAPGLEADFFDPFDESQIAEISTEAKKRFVRNGAFGKRLHELQEYNNFIRSYLASISYADDVLGRVLKAFEERGLLENTYVILWSDHGYHFGEKLAFRKFTLWEQALRVPLLFAGPGISPRRISDPVSNMDIYPTLMSLTGGVAPHRLDGQDLSPLLFGEQETLRGHSTSVYRVGQGKDERFASSVRTRTHRYIKYWRDGRELYDHTVDPHERHNLLFKSAGFLPWRKKPQLQTDLERLLPQKFTASCKNTMGKPGERQVNGVKLPHWSVPIVPLD